MHVLLPAAAIMSVTMPTIPALGRRENMSYTTHSTFWSRQLRLFWSAVTVEYKLHVSHPTPTAFAYGPIVTVVTDVQEEMRAHLCDVSLSWCLGEPLSL